MTFVDYAALTNQPDVGWCAVNPADGCLYTSADTASAILRYKIHWDQLGPSSAHDALEFQEAYPITRIRNAQGGAFTPRGELLYLSSGIIDCDDFEEWPEDGLHAIRTSDWHELRRSTNRDRGESGCFDYTFDNQAIFPIPTSGCEGEEPEGLDIWDLDGVGAPAPPLPGGTIKGQLHVLVYDHNFAYCDQNQSTVTLKHYGTVCPPNVHVACEGIGGTPATNADIARFLAGPEGGSASCGVAVGSYPALFPPGETKVTFTASGAGGTDISCDATVTVVDEVPPSIRCPADTVVESTISDGISGDDPSLLTYFQRALATDACDASPVVTIEKTPILAVGRNVVHFTARDHAGNMANCAATLQVAQLVGVANQFESTGALVGKDAQGSKGASNGQWLVRIPNAMVGAGEGIAPVGDQETLLDLFTVVHKAEGDYGFGVSQNGAQLVRIDLATGTVSGISTNRASNLACLAFDDQSGSVIAITVGGDRVIRIDPQSGSTSEIGRLGKVNGNVTGLGFKQDGSAFVLTEGPAIVRRVDLSSGVTLKSWSLLGLPHIRGLLWSTDGRYLYSIAELQGQSRLVRIDLETLTLLPASKVDESLKRCVGLAWHLNVPGAPRRARADQEDIDAALELGQRGPALLAGVPNPFTGATQVMFVLAARARLDLAVFDLNGRRVFDLASGEYGEGRHAVTWEGRGPNGLLVAPGIYIVRLATGKTVINQKLFRIR